MTVDEVITKLDRGDYGLNLPRRSRRQMVRPDESEVVKKYREGVKVRCIADEHNVSCVTLYKILRRNDVQLRGWRY